MNTGLADMKHDNLMDLTEGQMRIWSGQMLQPEEALYNMAFAFEIQGELNVSIFQKAFQYLTNQHDVLCVVITLEGDLPRQQVRNDQVSILEYLDISGEVSPKATLDSWIARDKKRLFAPGELLYSTTLFKLAPERYVWYINQHHLITDGWSYTLLYQDLNKHYQSLLSSEQVDLSTSNSFKEYVDANSFSKQQATSEYWLDKKEQITNPALFYGERTKTGSGASKRISQYLGKERTERLKAFCLEPEIRAWTVDMALNNVFLTLMNALIYKASGQSEFSLGVPSHNRITPKARKTAGLYMELMPLACSVSSSDTFLSLFEATRNEAMEVLKQAVTSRPSVEFLRSFNAIVNFIPQQFAPFGGLHTHTEWIHPDYHDPGHHLRLQIHDFDGSGDLLLQFDLNHEVFNDQKAEVVVTHFISLLDAFIEDKDQNLNDLEIISDQEINLLNAWNNTAMPIDESETLLSAFETQVSKAPENTALVFKHESVSYRELDEKSNQVAHYLIKNGLKPGGVVAIQLDRSFELMYSLYGLLKAGGVYLPLDVNNPADRTSFLLEDAEAKYLITKTEDADYNGLTLLQEELMQLVIDEPITSVNVHVESIDLAYIIYTSGSTGNPKGVLGYNEGLCNKLNWRKHLFPLTDKDVLIQKTPITFDVSLWELFLPLQVGATLVIAEPETHKDSAALIRLINAHQITTIHFVPSMLNAFLEDAEAASCVSIQNTFCSGEALSVAVVDKFQACLESSLHNLYGPTEASIDVTYWTCPRGNTPLSIPIGHAAPNTRLHVLDDNFNRVPLGTPGELFIGGNQVTKGYLNRPELTAVSFVKDIDPDTEGSLMYKTGDLVRYRADGALEYIGRQDNQVKLRGFRIELGEIEECMMHLSDISQAVVVKVEQESQGEYLVAYYTGALVEESLMRSLLSRYLPDYMIPSFFVFQEHFEHSSSGKVNRKILLNHTLGKGHSDVPYQAPETDLQEMVADVWKEILQLEKIGIYDQFTHLGGESLKALVITSRIKEMLDMELSVHLLFTYSDIASYAGHIEELMIEIMSQENA